MKKANGKQASESHSTSSGKWASQVIATSKNTSKGGLEITFDAGPSPWLQAKLRASGFRNSRRKTMWYADDTEQANDFAEKVKLALPSNLDGPELVLSPSERALKANLEKKAYSFVMITLKDGQTKNYIVFEPSKPRAEVIAANFADEKFGNMLSVFAVLPKTHIKEARVLFDEGRVIYPDGPPDQLSTATKDTNHVVSERSQQTSTGTKIPVKTIWLTTIATSREPDFKRGVELHTWHEADAYTKSQIGSASDVYYKIEWQNGYQFSGWVDIEPPNFFDNIPKPLSNHIKGYLTNYSKVREPHFLYDKEKVDHAVFLLENCLLEDIPKVQQPDPQGTETSATGDRIADQTNSGQAKDEEQPDANKITRHYYRAFYNIPNQSGTIQGDTQEDREKLEQWAKINYPTYTDYNALWKQHLRNIKIVSKLSEHTSRKPHSVYESIYSKLLKVIPGLIEHIAEGKSSGKSKVDPEGGLMALNYDFQYYDKNGNPVIALSHYFKQYGDMVADPDMEIRLMPDLQAAEAMTYQDQFKYQKVYFEKDGKQFVYPKLKKSLNSFLNQWLTNIIHQGHIIDLSGEDDEERNYYRQAWELAIKLVPNLTDPENKALIGRVTLPKDGKAPLREISCGLGRTAGGKFLVSFDETNGPFDRLRFQGELNTESQTLLVTSDWFSEGTAKIYGRSESEQQIQQRGGDAAEERTKGLISWLEEVLKSGVTIDIAKVKDSVIAKDTPTDSNEKAESPVTPYPSIILTGTPVFDPLVMVQLINSQNYLVNAWALSYQKADLKKKRFTAGDFGNLHSFFSIYVNEDRYMQAKYLQLYRDHYTHALDLSFHDGFGPCPNVLVPIGSKEPFYSHRWQFYDMRALIQSSYKLASLTNETLSIATPIQLYELAQLGNPKTYWVDVSQNQLMNVWQLRGKELFDTLGLPTNPGYPYADLIAGYESVRPLSDMLYDGTSDGNGWWIAAALYRPIADPEKAGAILDDMISHKERERKTYFTEDGKRPRPDCERFVKKVDRTISSLNEGKAVLNAYFQQLTTSNEAKPIPLQKDHLADEKGIYNKKSVGDGIERIEIPIPAEALYQATILLKKSGEGFKIGYSLSRDFKDDAYYGTHTKDTDVIYSSRKDALEAALQWHLDQLRNFYADIDKGYPSKSRIEQNTTRLQIVEKALLKYAQDHDIKLSTPEDEENVGIISDKPVDTDETSDSEDEHTNKPYDPLADDSGVYTNFSAGKNFEDIKIPMPKGSGYSAEIFLVKTTDKMYKQGILCSKLFGDQSYICLFPTTRDENYPTRKTALKAALLRHQLELKILHDRKDTILNNEASKKIRLTLALNAVKQFAAASGITLEATPDPEKSGIIKGLESAYWNQNDEVIEANQILVNGQAFNQSRLRDLVGERLQAMSLDTLEEIRTEVATHFKERRPFSSYEGIAAPGLKGEAKKASAIWAYIDDLIIDHDLSSPTEAPVMTLLIKLIFSQSPRLVDLPNKGLKTSKTNKPANKQSRYELNAEIEKFIDKKDEAGAYYTEEEKNYLKQYSGSGGLASEGVQGRGTLYEFYTPESIVKRMWDIAYHYGYDGGSILEPAVGTGHFLKYAPKDAAVYAFETNHYACRIAQILYPDAHIQEKAFETHFFAGNIHLKEKYVNPGYSLAIGNPPYGAFTGKYAGLGEKAHTGASEYDQYFLLRSLDLLKPGGLLVFLISSYFMQSMQKYNEVKRKIISKAEWLDGYRLPSNAMDYTDVGTDIIVLRKK